MVDFGISKPILDFEPVGGDNPQASRRFTAQMRDADGIMFTLNLFGFSNLTRAFGITGKQACYATPSYLDETIKSIARRRGVTTALAVGETDHVFTQDEQGIDTAKALVDKYELRAYSGTKASSLTLSRESFTPTGHTGDLHHIDAIVTASVAFNEVSFTTYTELLRQVCSNGMTQTIASSNKKNHYTSDWIPKAVENTERRAVGIKTAVDAMNEWTVKDAKGLIDSVRVCGIPSWVGDAAETLIELSRGGNLTEAEQVRMAPFGINTVWDYVNVCTWAMHRVKDISSKQKLQERLFKYTFREDWMRGLKEAEIVA
jgi:hypothetical protein